MKTLEAFDFGKRTGGKGKYDWAALLDGSIWELDQGTDFAGKASGMISAARVRAKKAGKTLRAARTATGIVIQAIAAPTVAPDTAPAVVADNIPKPRKGRQNAA